MTKGTLAFRIIICVILALAIAWSAFMSFGFIYYGRNYVHQADYGVSVAGVTVTRANKSDVLGDGTVSYNAGANTLIFNGAAIESDTTIVYTEKDLRIVLLGENKFVCKNNTYIIAIYAADYLLGKSISFEGEGSLSIEYQNVTDSAVAVYAEDVIVDTTLSITTPDCTTSVSGIACYDSLTLRSAANVTINSGAAKNSSAVSVRGNAILEPGAKMQVTARPGSTEACRGVHVEGDMILGKDTALSVSIDDEAAALSECVSVSGVLDVAAGASVTATAKKTHAIECYGAVKLAKDARVFVDGAGQGSDLFCYGAVVNYGAVVEGDVEALGGNHGRLDAAGA